MANNLDPTNGIYNEGACIKISFNKNLLLVNKSQIKTVDTIRTDVLRLDIGEGALKNIYIRLSEVSYPHPFDTVEALSTYIKELMIDKGFSTEAKQDVEIIELQQIKGVLQAMKNILQSGGGSGSGGTTVKLPLREDESEPKIIYKGYATANARPSDELWAIQKISRIDNEIIYEWADGDENYDNVWDNRYTISYFPSGFIQ